MSVWKFTRTQIEHQNEVFPAMCSVVVLFFTVNVNYPMAALANVVTPF